MIDIELFYTFGLVAAGWFTRITVGILQRHAMMLRKQNQTLEMLLAAGRIVAAQRDLKESLPILADLIVEKTSVSACRISLLDEHQKYLVRFGYSDARIGVGLPWDVEGKYLLSANPTLQAVG